MSKVLFIFDGIEVTIQCSKDEKMKDICQRYVNKIQKNINSLLFLYGGEQLNLELNFENQANIIDKERNEMKVLVYKNEFNEYICPNYSEKIKLNINDEIIVSINNIKDIINSIKLNINHIIKISSDNSINIQLKNINYLIENTLNKEIKNINEKIFNLLNNNRIKNENINTNYIISEIDIEDKDVNKNIRILNSYEENMRKYTGKDIENELKNENELKKCEIKINEKPIQFNYFYKFKSKGKYTIEYIFNNKITNTGYMFYECSKLIEINLSNFNTNNVKNMRCMFCNCFSLSKINLSNFNTNNVRDMSWMFSRCTSLTNINLSNFNTHNVINIKGMFYGCSSLSNINLSNFNTNKIKDMSAMFYQCYSLNNINLSNFSTNNVKDMNFMFYECYSLTSINLSNFNTHNVTYLDTMFEDCSKLRKENIITKDKKILNKFN